MIYVISDTHIPKRMSRFPAGFIDRVKEDDLIIHAGDFTALKVLRELERLATLHAICGNMDCPEIKEILTSKKIFELSGFRIGLIHGFGLPFDLVQRIKGEFREKLDLIIFGHTHSLCNLKEGGTLFFQSRKSVRNCLTVWWKLRHTFSGTRTYQDRAGSLQQVASS